MAVFDLYNPISDFHCMPARVYLLLCINAKYVHCFLCFTGKDIGVTVSFHAGW